MELLFALLFAVPIGAALGARFDRPVRPLAWGSLLIAAGVPVAAAVWDPSAFAGVVGLALLVGGFFAAVLAAGAVIEAGVGRLARRRTRRVPRTAPAAPRARPATRPAAAR